MIRYVGVCWEVSYLKPPRIHSVPGFENLGEKGPFSSLPQNQTLPILGFT